MPPAKERAKTNAGSDVKKGKSDPKGKQRAVKQDDIDLDVDTFVRNQIKALAAPLKPLDRSEYYTEAVDGQTHDPPLQKTLDKAVKALNLQLQEARQRKHTDASRRAIVEQIEYLKEEQAAQHDAPQLDEDGKIRVDQHDWLEELPDEWPVSHQHSVDLQQEALVEYQTLLAQVRDLKAERSILRQKEEHYAHLAKLLDEDIDKAKLATLLRGKPATLKGVRKSAGR